MSNFAIEMTPTRVTRRTRKSIEESQGKKIKTFMRKTKHARISRFLSHMCEDAGQCITFGTEIKKITDFFGGFKEFNYVSGNIKEISKGHNGFVKEIKYKHRTYEAYAILKSNLRKVADNLYYEYLVGQYINTLTKTFPCFLHTYGMYKYKSLEIYEKIKNSSENDSQLFKENVLQVSKVDISDVCQEPRAYCLLIQHIKSRNNSVQPIGDLMDNVAFLEKDLLYALIQIYIPLSTICDIFTHYDLHPDNVLLYELPDKKYVTYSYHVPGKVVTFRSKYICKIIDYGRCFFVDSKNGRNSKDIYENICQNQSCSPDCGKRNGFVNLLPENPPGSFYFISSSKRNMSHDLRLVYESFTDIIDDGKFPSKLLHIRALLKYGEGIANVDNKIFGTRENTACEYPNSINNVKDMATALIDTASYLSVARENEEHYDKYVEYGKMDIYCESMRATRFVKV